MDGFDFAADFLDFATALAMADNNPKEGWELRALHHVWAVQRKPRNLCSALHAKHLEQAKTRQTDEDQIDRDHEIEEARHDQNQNARDQGHDGLNMGSGDGHLKCLRKSLREIESSGILLAGTAPR
jgi:hypothetical protein